MAWAVRVLVSAIGCANGADGRLCCGGAAGLHMSARGGDACQGPRDVRQDVQANGKPVLGIAGALQGPVQRHVVPVPTRAPSASASPAAPTARCANSGDCVNLRVCTHPTGPALRTRETCGCAPTAGIGLCAPGWPRVRCLRPRRVHTGAGFAALDQCPCLKPHATSVRKPGPCPATPATARAKGIVANMTNSEEASILDGIHSAAHGNSHDGDCMGNTPAVPRLNVPSTNMQDAGQGFRTIDKSQCAQVASWPCGLAVAATFDTFLVERWGAALGAEFRGKGANTILGPSLDVHRAALDGRNAECTPGEDAFLGAQLVLACDEGVQSQKVTTNVKHFVLDDQETNRNTVNALVGERALQEIHVAPFRAGALARAASAMQVPVPNSQAAPPIVRCSEINRLWRCKTRILTSPSPVPRSCTSSLPPSLSPSLPPSLPVSLSLDLSPVSSSPIQFGLVWADRQRVKPRRSSSEKKLLASRPAAAGAPTTSSTRRIRATTVHRSTKTSRRIFPGRAS